MHMAFKTTGVNFDIADTSHKPSRHTGGVDLTVEFASNEEDQEAFQKLSDGGIVLMALKKQSF